MPLITYEQIPLRVEITDKVIGGTTVKRKALLLGMNQQLPRESSPSPFFGGGRVALSLLIEHFAVGENNTYGPSLKAQFPNIDYQANIVADSETLVNADTGAYLGKTSEYLQVLRLREENPELEIDLPEFLFDEEGNELNFMTEDAFFRRLADNIPIVVTALEQTYIQTASLSGKI